MLARIASTLGLWAITIFAVIYFGSLGWTVLIAVLAGGALCETCRLLERLGLKPMSNCAQVFSAAIFAASWLFPHFDIFHFGGGALIFGCCAVFTALAAVRDPYGDFIPKTVVPTIAAILCVPFPLHWLAVIGAEWATETSAYTGVLLAVWIVAAAKFSDVGAYVIGAAFGRHKMSPNISPNKTWEGAVGGLISAAAVSAAIAWLGSPILPETFQPLTAAIAGTAIGAAAILSDLLESVLKRRADIKDSGAFIPGIGGALDLADSLLLSVPLGATILAIIL